MIEIRFTWDDEKEFSNQKKHGITFDEAANVFYDPNLKVIDDPDHSQDEERFIALGFSDNANLLVVCHCYRESDMVIRIYSARKASRKETQSYTMR